MKKESLISIILPVFNGERYLREAIESCLAQTFDNFELIIVDDGSTDSSLKISQEYGFKDDRVIIVQNEVNKKLPASLNIGHFKAKGDFITWTSHDNIFHKDALFVLYENLKKQNADIVYSNYLLINHRSVINGFTRLKPIEYLLFSGVIGACFLYKKEVFKKNKGYCENLPLVEDFDFWLRALKHSKFSKIENPVYYYYRYHPESLTERMKRDKKLKGEFLINLGKVYQGIFSDLNLKHQDFLKDILVERFESESITPMRILNKKGVFNDIRKVASTFTNYSSSKLLAFITADLVETILNTSKYQNATTFFKLQREIGSELLNLPAKRYLALIKKCLF